MARVVESLAPWDNLPGAQSRSGFQAQDHVVIRREIKLGSLHILQGATGTVTAVHGKGRLLDVQFAAGSVTLHHLDLVAAQASPGPGSQARVMPRPGRNPLLARPDNPVHPHNLVRREPQVRIGRV
jgi:hypothetical protein